MRRQTRPFVVEVKKKRGDAARKQSMWGGMDLSAIAGETMDRLPAVEHRHSEEKAVEAAASEDVTVPTSTMALPKAQVDPDIDAHDSDYAPSETVDIEIASPRMSRRRRGSAETLPRGQRWKRRLPTVLRRKK